MNLLPLHHAADLLATRLGIPRAAAEQLLAENPVIQIRIWKRTRVLKGSVLRLADQIAQADEWLAAMRPTRTHPYDAFPAQARPRPAWRGGPRLSHADERAYFDEQDDQ